MPRGPVNAERGEGGGRSSDVVVRWWRHNDAHVFLIFAATATVFAAASYYGAMLDETGGRWSPPLDDTFVHFDHARSLARGAPFEWSEGNGFSSGNGSLLYPALLGLGYWLGFRGPSSPESPALMIWAALVATASLVALFAAAGRILAPLGRHARYLLPPAVLSVGAVGFVLWSGGEGALFVGAWGGLLAAAWRARQLRYRSGPAWVAGTVAALLVSIRPEAIACAAVLAAWVAWPQGAPRAMRITAVLFPPALVLGLAALANRMLTGEWAPAGVIAAGPLFDPYLGATARLDLFLVGLGQSAAALGGDPSTSTPTLGWLMPALAVVPLLPRQTRGLALALWAQIGAWMWMSALCGDARSGAPGRHAMPAVVWLLFLDAMALALLFRARRGRRSLVGCLAAAGLAGVHGWHQAPRLATELHAFARASLGLLDRQVALGELVRQHKPKRVLVGETGAITFVSDRAGLDLGGAGGYFDLPFARARWHGVGASIELLEHLRTADRPDLMAFVPADWGELPTYFGRYLESVGPEGGRGGDGAIYEARWGALDRLGRPRALSPGEWVVDELDIADLVSEVAHDYEPLSGTPGEVRFRVLNDPSSPDRDLFDAGRFVGSGSGERASLRAPRRGGRLVLRLAPEKPGAVRVRVDGEDRGVIAFQPGGSRWQELSMPVAAENARLELELETVGAPTVHYHVWIVEARDG